MKAITAIEDGRLLAGALCLFDLVLGSIALFLPHIYADVFHPHLADPQWSLIRRMGVVWLGYATVALLSARAPSPTRLRWFFALAVLRLIEVPADLLYGTLAEGAPWWSRALLYSAPPINLAAGAFLVWICRRSPDARSAI